MRARPAISAFREVYGQSPDEWGTEIFYARIERRRMVAFAMTGDE